MRQFVSNIVLDAVASDRRRGAGPTPALELK